MTEEQKERIIKDPKAFFKSCWYHEQGIKLKLEEIRHYRDLAESITAELKPVAVFGALPASKVENCVVEIVAIQENFQKELMKMRADLDAVQEAINLLDDDVQKQLLEARYVRHMTWEEIAILLDCSYRWTLRLHGAALKKISQQAMLIHY